MRDDVVHFAGDASAFAGSGDLRLLCPLDLESGGTILDGGQVLTLATQRGAQEEGSEGQTGEEGRLVVAAGDGAEAVGDQHHGSFKHDGADQRSREEPSVRGHAVQGDEQGEVGEGGDSNHDERSGES